MFSKRIIVTALAPILCVLLSGCAFILEEEVEVKGQVRLSDNPVVGHGGVTVTNGYTSTVSDAGGIFSLRGHILEETHFTLELTKDGYEPGRVTVDIPYQDDDENSTSSSDFSEVVDVGTVTLRKL